MVLNHKQGRTGYKASFGIMIPMGRYIDRIAGLHLKQLATESRVQLNLFVRKSKNPKF